MPGHVLLLSQMLAPVRSILTENYKELYVETSEKATLRNKALNACVYLLAKWARGGVETSHEGTALNQCTEA